MGEPGRYPHPHVPSKKKMVCPWGFSSINKQQRPIRQMVGIGTLFGAENGFARSSEQFDLAITWGFKTMSKDCNSRVDVHPYKVVPPQL